MKLETALQIATEIAAAYRKWGKQANPPYTTHQLCEALAALDAAGHFSGDIAAELTKTKRQLAASSAREAALKKRLGESE